MGFLEKKLKKGLKKGMKEFGLKPEKHKKKKDKKHKDYSHHAPPPPPGRAPPPGHHAAPPPSHHAPPQQRPGSEVEMYLQQLQGWDGESRKKAAKKLEKMMKKNVNALSPHLGRIISLLGHQEPKVKQLAAKLIRAGAKTAPMLFKVHLDTLQRLLNDPNPKVRENLMDAVQRINSMLGGGVGGGTQVTNIYQTAPPPQAQSPSPPAHSPPPPAHAPSAPVPPSPSEVLETGKPGVHLDVIEEDLPYKRWGMIQLKVENHSEVDIYNISVEVKGPVEVSPIDTIHHIAAGESEVLEIGMKAAEAGRVPAHLSAIYYDRNRREFKHSRQDWIKVMKPEKAVAATGTHINIGSIGDIVSDHSTQIHDSVLQRSNIGGGGGGGSGGGGGGSTVIKGSTVQRSNISGGGNVEVEDSVMMRSNVGGGGAPAPPAPPAAPSSCPKCGRELKEGWAMCPACGTKL
ncbi:MAG: zinc-ribbon domain-containing protein [Candidatus Thermoplasmatota archaeon]|nr:zinc-ribbon domain-containing protein [Candidatus Thermoplasmatota archaeon]